MLVYWDERVFVGISHILGESKNFNKSHSNPNSLLEFRSKHPKDAALESIVRSSDSCVADIVMFLFERRVGDGRYSSSIGTTHKL